MGHFLQVSKSPGINILVCLLHIVMSRFSSSDQLSSIGAKFEDLLAVPGSGGRRGEVRVSSKIRSALQMISVIKPANLTKKTVIWRGAGRGLIMRVSKVSIGI